jgi:hypothetical protein
MFARLLPGALAACLALAAASALVACGASSDDDAAPARGPARPFLMGFSTLPRELTGEAYAETFELAADHGEIVLVQRTPPWEEFLAGGAVSDATAATTASEKQALSDRDLRLFFAIDPTDSATGRDRLAALPEDLAGRNFGDPQVREAFVSYAKYVALNYKPDYLALGVEVNLYYRRDEDDFENFKSLYAEAYAAVKDASPGTQITATFQYEDLQGILPTQDKHFADWQLLKAFDPLMDFVAISTHPSLAFPLERSIPDNYYSQLSGFTSLPIAIAEMSYSSALGSQGVNNGSEADQKAYLRRVLDQAEEMEMAFVIWLAGWDPAFTKGSDQSAFEHTGLLRADNSQKPAWPSWADAAARPLLAAGAAR